MGSGSVGLKSKIPSYDHQFFPKGTLLPVELFLCLEEKLECGNEAARDQLNLPTALISAQDPAFPSCWFSRAIDLGDDSGHPAFWMLQKTAKDEWRLCLRRSGDLLVTYLAKGNIASFSFSLTRGEATKDFHWPRTITISDGVPVIND